MILIRLFISCGEDVSILRDIAQDVVRRLNQMLMYQMELPVQISEWDYRDDPGTVVEAENYAKRSLELVDRSDAMVNIFGAQVPEVTRLEVRRAFELRIEGTEKPLWPFLNPAQKNDDHRRLLAEIEADFAPWMLVYEPYDDELDFQAKLFTALVPYVMKRASLQTGAA
jgi:hypothetical protein